MKFSIFAMTAMVATAFAAPSVPSTHGANSAIEELTSAVTDDLGASQLLSKRDSPIKDGASLISVLTSGLESIKVTTGAINSTLAQVQSGAVSKDNGTKSTSTELGQLHYKLTDILQKLHGAAGIKIDSKDNDSVLSLIVDLVSEILYTVKAILTVLDLGGLLSSILHLVFTLVAEILEAVVELVGAIVPDLVDVLSSLLGGLGDTVLAPLLSIIANVLAALIGSK